jgi:CBS domain-containing protein
MPIGDICVLDVVTCNRDTKIDEVAQLMRRHHVGDVVVTDQSKGKPVPVGIITDRDIVASVIALELDPTIFSAGDLVSRPLITVREDFGVFEVIQQMRKNGVRRMPVVDEAGALVGIVSVDDLIDLLAAEMGELAKLISREQAEETRRKPASA